MTNYVELTKQLKEQDEHIISKLSIYHELSSLTNVEELAAEDVDEIVEYLHDVLLNSNNKYLTHPKLVGTTLSIYHCDLQQLLTSIKENSDQLRKQILERIELF